MQLQTQIRTVRDDIRKWESRNGPMYSVEGTFDDGSGWSVSFKTPERAHEQQDVLKAQIGFDKSFEIEDTGREYRGAKQYKLVNYPGKPQPAAFGGGGGGKAPYQPRFRDTEDGFRQEQDSIHRSVALQQAVAFCKEDVDKAQLVTEIADHFHKWLVGPQRAAPASPAQVQAQSQQASKLVEQAKNLFNEPEPPPARNSAGYQTKVCPKCGKAEAVRKSKIDGCPPWYCYAKIGGCGHQWGDTVPLTNDTPKEERSVAVMASEEVDKCVKGKDLARLMQVAQRIVDAHHDGRISDAEMQELDIEVTTGKKAIESGQSHEAWYRTKLAEVQQRTQELSPEMQDLGARF